MTYYNQFNQNQIGFDISFACFLISFLSPARLLFAPVFGFCLPSDLCSTAKPDLHASLIAFTFSIRILYSPDLWLHVTWPSSINSTELAGYRRITWTILSNFVLQRDMQTNSFRLFFHFDSTDISDTERPITTPPPTSNVEMDSRQQALNYSTLAAAAAANVPNGAQDSSLSSTETLLRNIQGLLKVAADNARQQERQISFEKSKRKYFWLRKKKRSTPRRKTKPGRREKKDWQITITKRKKPISKQTQSIRSVRFPFKW